MSCLSTASSSICSVCVASSHPSAQSSVFPAPGPALLSNTVHKEGKKVFGSVQCSVPFNCLVGQDQVSRALLFSLLCPLLRQPRFNKLTPAGQALTLLVLYI